MAREPDPGAAFVFDLVEDDAAAAGVPGTPTGTEPAGDDGDGTGPGEPPSGARGLRLRAVAPVAAVLAILLGTGFAVDGLRERARMERVRDSYGGVLDVSSPLEELWEWKGTVGPPGDRDGGRWNEVAALGDLLAFLSRDALVALDPATGDEAWRIELGEDPDCGPMGSANWSEAVTQSVVCLTGPDTEREVLVVGADGVPSPGRVLDAADTSRYGEARPGPGGTVLRAARVGPEPPADGNRAECTGVGVCTGTVDTGRDLQLRAEDARTGAVRWNVTVPFRRTSADQCTNWYSTSWDRSSNIVNLDDMLDAEGFGARITGDVVQLFGCGVEATVTREGLLLGTRIAPGTGDVESLRTGGYTGYTYGEAAGTVLYDADGVVVGDLDGYLLEPNAVDGVGPDTLLASGTTASRLRAYAPDGTLRWEVAAESEAYVYLAQVNGSAVVLTGEGTVRGLDLETGDERFTWTTAKFDEAYASGLYVSRAFTDGQFVLLVVQSGHGGLELLALDAVTGETAWRQDRDEVTENGRIPAPSSGLLALGGYLLEVTPGGVRGLG